MLRSHHRYALQSVYLVIDDECFIVAVRTANHTLHNVHIYIYVPTNVHNRITDRQFTYNVTLRRVCATTVAVEKQ